MVLCTCLHFVVFFLFCLVLFIVLNTTSLFDGNRTKVKHLLDGRDREIHLCGVGGHFLGL